MKTKDINWKQKLTSRKFWAAVGGFVTMLLVTFNVPDLTVQQIGGLVTAGATLIAYIIGEGLTDAARCDGNQGTTESQNLIGFTMDAGDEDGDN